MKTHDNPLDLTTQEAEHAEAVRQEQLASENEVANIKWLMGDKRGRHHMWGLLEKAGVYRTSFSQNGSVTSFNEGQRNVGLAYVGLVQEHCLGDFVKMINEHGIQK